VVKYLLDTNICIAWLKGDNRIRDKLLPLSPEDVGMSTINLAELFFGAYNSEKVEHNLARLTEFISEIQVITLDTDSLKEYGQLKTLLRGQGNIIDEFDLLIASICIAHAFFLVTNNQKHLARIEGSKLENWLTS
jgi:tRNA(fMet)-specific endonuclease VapC